VRVPEYVVAKPETITGSACMSESDLEVRRVMIERMGVDNFLLDVGGTLVDMDYVPLDVSRERTMPRALFELPDGQRILHGTDGSTERSYWMSVDSETKTCRQAHESICGLDESLCVAQS
jgi:hypothetical protein